MPSFHARERGTGAGATNCALRRKGRWRWSAVRPRAGCDALTQGPVEVAMRTMVPTLYVGNRNYSSWSLRPWLVLKWSRLPFDTTPIPLGGEGYGKGLMRSVLGVSPTGFVPALHLGDAVVWDSLAISEWAAESAPSAHLWPQDPVARAVARSAT